MFTLHKRVVDYTETKRESLPTKQSDICVKTKDAAKWPVGSDTIIVTSVRYRAKVSTSVLIKVTVFNRRKKDSRSTAVCILGKLFCVDKPLVLFKVVIKLLRTNKIRKFFVIFIITWLF